MKSLYKILLTVILALIQSSGIAATIAVFDVRTFGAIGDFNPATGTGTDDRAAIQSAINQCATKSPCEVLFRGGNFYLGPNYTDSTGSIITQLVVGDKTAVTTWHDITLKGEGAAIYAGAPGRAIGIFHSNNVRISGLKLVGYAGGTLGPAREADILIFLAFANRHVTIDHNYITNCLGWQIGQYGDPTVSGGGTGATSYDTIITDNIIKARYGDGVPSPSSGSMTQNNIQFTDAIGVTVANNTIIGRVDFEPNLTGQYITNIDVHGNRFDSGFVTPVIPTGITNYWTDEPLIGEAGGGTRIVQSVAVQTSAQSPTEFHNVIKNNSFDWGQIVILVADHMGTADILNNRFRYGKILAGGDSLLARNFAVNGNVAENSTDGIVAFIQILGNLSTSTLMNNVLLFDTVVPVIGSTGSGTGDSGNNIIINNVALSFAGNPIAIAGTANTTSVYAKNVGGFNYGNYEVNTSGTIGISTTKTITIAYGGNGAVQLQITVGANVEGGLAHSRAIFLVGGKISDGTYGNTSVVLTNSAAGTLAVSALTQHNGNVTFTIQNLSGVQTGSYTVSVLGSGYGGFYPTIGVSP